MRKIRKLYYFDKKSTEEMISFLNNRASDTYVNRIMFNPLLPFHYLLPLGLKFLPESYILRDEKTSKGLITVAPIRCKQKKVEIQKLFFEEGAYGDASELVQFVVSKYKANGAVSILVKVDDYLPELLAMLVTKCGFSQISYEKLWRVDKFIDATYNKRDFRPFKNSDANVVATLYNDSLLSHIRPLLSKEPKEYKEPMFMGLSYFSEYKFVLEDKKTRNTIACLVIHTYDNENFVLDIIQTGWVDIDIDSLIAYATYQIKKRKKRFALFVKTKRYTQMGEKYEAHFVEKGFECVQNQVVLTNSSARVLRNSTNGAKYTVLTDFSPTRVVSTKNVM